MSKKWEYSPSDLRIFSAEAQLSKSHKKSVMARLKSDACEGSTSALLFFSTAYECKLTKTYLQSLGYTVESVAGYSQTAIYVSWREKNE
jgi:hypothetical protein